MSESEYGEKAQLGVDDDESNRSQLTQANRNDEILERNDRVRNRH
jgi:hypothetical protein